MICLFFPTGDGIDSSSGVIFIRSVEPICAWMCVARRRLRFVPLINHLAHLMHVVCTFFCLERSAPPGDRFLLVNPSLSGGRGERVSASSLDLTRWTPRNTWQRLLGAAVAPSCPDTLCARPYSRQVHR